MRRSLIAVVVIATLAAACSNGSTGDRTTQATSPPATITTTAPAAPSTRPGLVVYALAETADLFGPYLVAVAREGVTEATAAAAVDMVLAGLTFTETGHGLWTEIPPGLHANFVGVGDDGIVTVDLPREFEMGGGTATMLGRLAQLVASVLDIPGAEGVRLAIDGTAVDVFSSEGIVLDDPMTRDSIREFVAPVSVASPAWGATVSVPFRVNGSTREASAVGWALTDRDGRIVVEGVVPVDGVSFRIDVSPPSSAIDPAAAPYQHTLTVWEDIDGAQRNIMECVLSLDV